MDTMEITKIAGGIFGALLIYLLLNWAGETIYHVEASTSHGAEHGDDHGGHGEKAKSAYFIEVAEAASTSGGEDEPGIEEMILTADAGKGARVFSKCKACHKLEDGENGVGPHLFAVVDRAIGGVDGFSYTAALTGLGGAWDINALDGFLENPKKYAPGTKMSFAGLRKASDRANLIAYLQTIQ